VKSVSDTYRFSHSPGAGGFGSTPFFLNPPHHHNVSRFALPLLSEASSQPLLPSAADLLRLILQLSSQRGGSSGIISAWMGDLDPTSSVGKMRLLVGLGYILLDNNSQISGSSPCVLTWHDVRYLQVNRERLSVIPSNDAKDIVYMISLILEDLAQKDLSFKFRLENVLDFNDQITLRGWTDGGRDSEGTHAEELRMWYARKCRELGITKVDRQIDDIHDLSPIRRRDNSSSDDKTATTVQLETDDPFGYDVVDVVIGSLPIGRFSISDDMQVSTPKSSPVSDEELCALREIIVVDVQTDHSLRRHINKAMELRKGCVNERAYVAELRKFIQRRLYFENADSKGTISKLARAREGFVHIGDVRAGAQSRHFAILFKTLCDATGVFCRLVRDEDGTYYNVVMISDNGSSNDVGAENIQDSFANVSRSDGNDAREDDLDDAPEELIPVFWEPTALAPHKRIRLSHPLDCLLQKCNNAADPVDLDEFFSFDNLLGKGSFGEVWRIHLKGKSGKKNGENSRGSSNSILLPGNVSKGPFALKLIPPEEADKEEASFMRIYGHPRVINVIAVFRGYQELENRKRELERKPAVCILMEMADKCLETVLTQPASGQPENSFIDLRFVFRILIDTARAMAFLHSPVGQRPHLVHRDLKPGNILITTDNRAIVTDFGVARMNPSLETNLTVGAGTDGYMAPEQRTLLYDRPADVYSFGIIIARILGIENWKDSSRLTEDEFNRMGCDPVLSQLCLKCVQTSPLHRPSFDQIHQLLLSEFIMREFSRALMDESSRTGKASNNAKLVRQDGISASHSNPSDTIRKGMPRSARGRPKGKSSKNKKK